jgi:hypothetical protein
MTSAKITDSLSHKQRQRFLYHFALPSIIFYNCYYFAGMIIHCMFWRNYQNKRIHNVCVLLVRYNSSYKLCKSSKVKSSCRHIWFLYFRRTLGNDSTFPVSSVTQKIRLNEENCILVYIHNTACVHYNKLFTIPTK